MFSTDDTIVAVATPAGHGGVGVVRLSGPRAAAIGLQLAGRARQWTARRVVRASIRTGVADADALVTFFAGPASYTGQDVLEVSAHGNPVVLSAIVERAVALGARAARRGEFTLRAFLSGKVDLAQAEGVRDLVEAVSPAQVRCAAGLLDGTLTNAIAALVDDLRALETRLEASMDFPDEGYRFLDAPDLRERLTGVHRQIERLLSSDTRTRLVRDGLTIVVAGAPNVGKSSVFNAIVGDDRAIVTPVAGTTRDLVSERVVIGETTALVIDTAGVRTTSDVVEAEGVRRAESAIGAADVVLLVLDGSRPMHDDELTIAGRDGHCSLLTVVNKADLPQVDGAEREAALGDREVVHVSARTGFGLERLLVRLAGLASAMTGPPEAVLVSNERHRGLLRVARSHLARALEATDAGAEVPEELLAADVRLALAALEDVTGRRTPDEVLEEIFATFCIGK